MSGTKLFRWWRYSSFWKFFGILFLAVILCFVCAKLISGSWCLFGIFSICGICGYIGYQIFEDVLYDIIQEFERE